MRKFFLCLVILFLLSPACQFDGSSLHFETIEQTERSRVSRFYNSPEPELIVIAQPTDIATVTTLLLPEISDKLKALNYQDSFAIIVFQGQKPSTGYSVQIESIVRRENVIVVNCKFIQPGPTEPTNDAITSPHHLVKVQKAGVWNQTFTLSHWSQVKVTVKLSSL